MEDASDASVPLYKYGSILHTVPPYFPMYALCIGLYNLSNPGYEGLESNQPPKLGEWTRIEISHEEENGKWILSFSVGGKEVGRDEVDQSSSRDITDVKIYIGTSTSPWADHTGPIQPGFIRGLVVWTSNRLFMSPSAPQVLVVCTTDFKLMVAQHCRGGNQMGKIYFLMIPK